MKSVTHQPGARPHPQDGALHQARCTIDTFVAAEGRTWVVLYALAGIVAVVFFVVLVIAAGNGGY